MKKKVMISGCEGQLGKTLQELAPLHPEYQFFNTDIKELDLSDFTATQKFIDQNEIEIVINAAGYTAVERAEEEIEAAYSANCQAVENLARAIAKRNGFMIHISTDYVFDGKKGSAYTPEDLPCPLSVYGASKLAGEKAMCSTNVRGVIIRIAWLYSTFGNNFVKTMLKLSAERESIQVVNDQWGAPTNALDLSEVIFQIIAEEEVQNGVEIYHYSNAGLTTWHGFAKEIIRLSGAICEVKATTSEAFGAKVKRPTFSQLSTDKLTKRFDIKIPKWEESLARDLFRIKY